MSENVLTTLHASSQAVLETMLCENNYWETEASKS